VDYDIQSKSETTHSVAHKPNFLVVSILPHGEKVLAVLPLVRQRCSKWSCDNYDTHKKTWVRRHSQKTLTPQAKNFFRV